MVRPGSLLSHHCISTGRWTINQGQIQYINPVVDLHQNQILIFSTEKEQSKQIATQTPTADSYLKQFDLGFGMAPSLPPKYFLINNKWILLTAKQLMTKYEDSKKNNTVLSIKTEESLFEQV